MQPAKEEPAMRFTQYLIRGIVFTISLPGDTGILIFEIHIYPCYCLFSCGFNGAFVDIYLEHLSEMNPRAPYWWSFNFGSGSGLVLLCPKPFPRPMFTFPRPPVCWSTFGILVWNDSGYVNLTQWWYFFIIFEYILHISMPHIMIFCFPLPYFPLSTSALLFA